MMTFKEKVEFLKECGEFYDGCNLSFATVKAIAIHTALTVIANLSGEEEEDYIMGVSDGVCSLLGKLAKDNYEGRDLDFYLGGCGLVLAVFHNDSDAITSEKEMQKDFNSI